MAGFLRRLRRQARQEHRFVDRPEIARLARAEGLTGAFADRLAELARPSVRLVPGDGDPDPLGSRLGGDPAVPSDFTWPTWSGKALAFMGQVRLEELGEVGRSLGLPEAGLLSCFYEADEQPWGFDPNDAGCGRLFWFQPDAALREAAAPPPAERFTPIAVTSVEEWTIPGWDSLEFEDVSIESIVDDGDANDAFDRLDALIRRLEAVSGNPAHRIGGFPDLIQSDMRLEAELGSSRMDWGATDWRDDPRAQGAEERALDWQLVLQIDSDEQVGTMFGDVGKIYFLMRTQDLAARDFDRSWLVLQCY